MSVLNALFIFIICYATVLFILVITPYITRKTECFGVTVPEEVQSEREIVETKREYRNKTLLYGGIFSLVILILMLTLPQNKIYIFLPMGTFILLGISFVLYLKGHKKIKALKQEKDWTSGKHQRIVIDTEFRSGRIMVSPLWFLLNIAIIVITLSLELIFYKSFPDRIPTGWDINGHVKGWVDKSYKFLLFAPAGQLFMTLIMVFTYWCIGKSKQLVDPKNPENSLEQNRRFRYRWSIFVMVCSFSLSLLFGLLQFYMLCNVNNMWLIMGTPALITLGILAYVIVLSITTGQGGSRVYVKNATVEGKTESKAISRDDDRYWKLGLFYYNPDDPSFIVEKRFGIGWTNNWARPISWIITVGLLVVIAAFAVVSAILAS